MVNILHSICLVCHKIIIHFKLLHYTAVLVCKYFSFKQHSLCFNCDDLNDKISHLPSANEKFFHTDMPSYYGGKKTKHLCFLVAPPPSP